MSEPTKEWLQQTIAELEEERDAVPGFVNEDAAMALAAMKLALASLEAEPVTPSDVAGPLAHAYKELTPTLMRNHIDVFERYGIYPDGSAGIQAMRIALDGMNRRAAMLQGADGNSPVIPDGLRLALSNAGIAAPESDEMLAATCEKYIQELVTWVKDRKPFRSAVIPDGWVACSERMPEIGSTIMVHMDKPQHSATNYAIATYDKYGFSRAKFTHWQPLPAAPQQE